MKITIVTANRQKGKTDLALYEMSKKPNKTFYFSHYSKEAINRFKNRVEDAKFELHNFLSYSNASILSMRPEVIIFDEFFFAKNYKKIWEAIMPLEPKKVFIFSSIRGQEISKLKQTKLLGNKSIEKQEDLSFINTLKENYKAKHIKLK